MTTRPTTATGVPGLDWDRQVAQGGGHVYQSRAWAKFQVAQGRPVLSAADATWSWLAAVRRGRGGITYLYAAYGPTIHVDGLAPAVASLVRAGRAVQADFIRLEPLGAVQDTVLRACGARPIKDMQPRYRLVLDLSAPETRLRRHVSASNRNLITTAAKCGLSCMSSSDRAMMSKYLAMQRHTAARQRFTTQPDAYYERLAQTLFPTGAAHLYVAVHDRTLVASAIGMDFGGTRYYLYAVTYPDLNLRCRIALPLRTPVGRPVGVHVRAEGVVLGGGIGDGGAQPDARTCAAISCHARGLGAGHDLRRPHRHSQR